MRTSSIFLLLIAGVVGAAAFMMTGSKVGPSAQKSQSAKNVKVKMIPKDAQTLVLAGGCFWCLEVIFEELKGVYDVESGYAGGAKAGITYREVGGGDTGHAEVIKISFDPKVISTEALMRLFFVIHDPTTLNSQGPDYGTQYRSSIFYSNQEEKALAEKILKETNDKKIWQNPIVTTIEPLTNYTVAESYHQDYFVRYEQATPLERAGMNSGYCAAIIEPKVKKFRKEYLDKLKKGG
jgi:peptide-methionine (S)-S-oxide reductase